MNKYSIIIPCYNSSNTIIRCINSCINQTYKNIEIILIDDGSIDNTYELCEEYLKNNDKIKLLKKKNGGVSSARNLGIKQASGNRIVFLDSDDEFRKNALEELNKYDCDLVIAGLTEKNKGLYYDRIPKFSIKNNLKDILNYGFKKENFTFLSIPVAKAFNLNIIRKHNIKFDENLHYGEDTAFIIDYIMYCNDITYINKSIYLNNTENIFSLSRKKNEHIWQSVNKIIVKFENSFKQFNNTDEYKLAYTYLYIRNIKISLLNFISYKDYKGFYNVLNNIAEDMKFNLNYYKFYNIKDKIFFIAIRNRYRRILLILFKVISRKC